MIDTFIKKSCVVCRSKNKNIFFLVYFKSFNLQIENDFSIKNKKLNIHQMNGILLQVIFLSLLFFFFFFIIFGSSSNRRLYKCRKCIIDKHFLTRKTENNHDSNRRVAVYESTCSFWIFIFFFFFFRLFLHWLF